ncbi:MAG: hemerythrin [Deltaproteobacteria bacterium]|jgi:hemerythrin-like domain-containing protein|nr:hemerythrin [Deltaproteobacteria bacterium]
MSATVELLGRQHQDVLARLSAVEQAGNGAGVLADFATYLQREVMEHFVLEEQALFPILERHIGRTHGPLAVMDMEHATFRELLEGLTAGLGSDDTAQAQRRTHAIIDLLRDHIAKEDNVLFPMAARVLSGEEHAEVDARAAAVGTAAATQ